MSDWVGQFRVKLQGTLSDELSAGYSVDVTGAVDAADHSLAATAKAKLVDELGLRADELETVHVELTAVRNDESADRLDFPEGVRYERHGETFDGVAFSAALNESGLVIDCRPHDLDERDGASTHEMPFENIQEIVTDDA